MDDVCVVLVNYNGWKDTCECINSLKRLYESINRVIVVDNASSNDSARKLKKTFLNDKKIIILESEKNRGFSAGNNIGIKFALQNTSCNYVWLLNNDTVVDINALSALKNEFEKNSRLGVAGSVLCEYDERNKIQSVGGMLNLWTFRYKPIGRGKTLGKYMFPKDKFLIDACGASFMMSRKYLEKVGLLDECYFLYGEEIDISNRSRNDGWDVYPVYESIVYHKESASIGKNPSPFKDYHVVRSKIILTRKYYLNRILLMLIVDVIIRALLRGINFKFKNISAIIKGLKDGMNVDVSNS